MAYAAAWRVLPSFNEEGLCGATSKLAGHHGLGMMGHAKARRPQIREVKRAHPGPAPVAIRLPTAGMLWLRSNCTTAEYSRERNS